VSIKQRVTSSRGIKGGRPVISGTKISVIQVLELVEGGLTPEQIAEDYEDIRSPEAVRCALKWADEHPERVDELRAQRERAKESVSEEADVY
jgi:uncharacterized protein (DUF433 family)